MDAYKCDRCGEFYESMIAEWTGRNTPAYGNNVADFGLCDECVGEFETFMDGKETDSQWGSVPKGYSIDKVEYVYEPPTQPRADLSDSCKNWSDKKTKVTVDFDAGETVLKDQIEMGAKNY